MNAPIKNQVRVLLVDDHQVICDALTCYLDESDDVCAVGKAYDGREAIRLVDELSPDLVVLDISMPVLNGIEVARTLKQLHPEVHLIMLSMHSDAELVFESLNAGARGFVLKECAGKELIRAIQVVVKGEFYLTPSLVSSLVSEYLRIRVETPEESPLSVLSSRELEVLRAQAEGCSTREIAENLHLSPKTVETYRYRIKEKINIRENAGLIKFAIRNGLVSLD